MILHYRKTSAAIGAKAVATATVVVAVLGTVVVGLPTPAQADEVAAAEARVAQLRTQVRTVTSKLTEGTKKYEADQSALKETQRQLARSQRAISEVRAEANAGSAKLNLLARQMYMAPGPVGLKMATQRPEQVVDSLQMNEAVARVAGTQDDIVRRAVAARVTLQGQEQAIVSLTAEARKLTRRSAERLRGLEALAARTAEALETAQSALTSARSRAAAAKSRAQRASRSRATSFASGPSCSGAPTSGESNGNLDPGSLCPLWMAPGQSLRADAAAAFNKMSQYHAASVGSPLCVSDSYRSYSAQVSVYQRKPGLAAVPGTSEHGWGKAVDFCGGVERFGSEAYNWMKQNAGRFGFFHPDWAEQSGSKPEAWHWEFNG